MLSRSSRRTTPVLVAAVALGLSAANAGAQSLSGTLTVDNAFQAFLSTSATTLGIRRQFGRTRRRPHPP